MKWMNKKRDWGSGLELEERKKRKEKRKVNGEGEPLETGGWAERRIVNRNGEREMEEVPQDLFHFSFTIPIVIVSLYVGGSKLFSA